MKKIRCLLIIIALFVCFTGKGQIYQRNGLMLQAGITFSLGTHVNRLGILANLYYVNHQVQIGSRLSWYYMFTSLGPSLRGGEFSGSLGILVGYGTCDSIPFAETEAQLNQTGFRNSVSYFYHLYLNHVKTSQPTGTIGFNWGRWTLITENDIFGKSASDKFRTAAASISYLYGETTLTLKTILWTGNPKGSQTIKDSTYPSRWGYRDISNNEFGKYSNGILALGISSVFEQSQVINLETGIDSERIRHGFQNIFIHDMYFVPSKWNKARNPHYPMLDKQGMPYLYRENQRVKPAKWYFQFSGNDTQFY